jgi:mono/diheme cytochrome c family protein/glucose/arabinose dehydrogenase
MFHAGILPTALLLAAAVITSSGIQTPPAARPWPPAVQPVPDGSPVLSPDEEMKSFSLPPGYRVELVASEPMVQEPVLIDWDPDGRMWVIEMLGYMQDMPATNEREANGRVSVLEDVDRDGKMDKKTIFLDGLVLPRALKVLDHGVLVGEPPNLWLARDTDGDLRADTKQLVTSAYGRLEANVEHNANGLLWALDNWMHTSESDVYLRLRNGAFEVRKTLPRGQWGQSQDDAGRIYRNSNESVLHVDIVSTPYFARNSNLLRTRGSYESLRGEKNEVMTVWPVRPTRGVNRGYQTGVLRADGTLASYTAVASPVVYRGDRLPAELQGNLFVVDPAANVVSRIVVSDDGTALRARKAYERAEFLASTDERFRPVYVSNAPDGTLYIVDMYRGIIQHRAYITEYLRNQIVARKLEAPTRHGRIYRVVHDTGRGSDGSARNKPSLAHGSSASHMELVELLAHPNGWWRDTAQRLLVERGDRSVVPALRQRAESAPDYKTRLHALWTLEGLDSLQPDTVARALDNSSRDVRTSAIRLAERWLREPDHPIRARVLKHLDDPDWAVRRQLAASLGELPLTPREAALTGMLERFGNDPIIVDTVLSGLQGSEMSVLEKLLHSSSETPQRVASITMLAATIARGAQDASVQNLFQWVAQDARTGWQRSALLRGVEVALLGAAMPGGGGRGGAGVAAGRAADARGNTEAGARGGPGGSPAFPRAGAARGGGRGAGTVTALKLTREPALVALAARDRGELGQRATTVLARVAWPGKPVDAIVTPLTADEQQRFAAGREVYVTLCSACHQPDGRGREHLAPSLIGSEMALGTSGVAVRIVLNGKEGSTGLMPPLGFVLSDDQIAAALTYIRREWGHTASAVDASTVKDIRGLTTGRSRPWTAEELSQLLK